MLVAITLGSSFENAGDTEFALIEAKLKARFPDYTFIVLPPDCTMKVSLPDGYAYHREKIADYEIELIAASEAELLLRLDTIKEVRKVCS